MTEREALVAALVRFNNTLDLAALDPDRETEWSMYEADCERLVAAARERLGQMPSECPECQGTLTVEPPISGADPHGAFASSPCFACNQTGKVYPAETLEKIARIIAGGPPGLDRRTWEDAVAVLDALNEEAT